MLRIITAFLVFAMWSGTGHAATYWSAIATGCVPDAQSIQGDRYRPSGDSMIKHKSGNVARIVLICAVQPHTSVGNPALLTMTYIDSTGAGSKAFVKAQLFAVTRATGLKTLLATVNSNSSSEDSLDEAASPSFAHSLDFDLNYYFVRIEMDRSATGQNAGAVGVALREDD